MRIGPGVSELCERMEKLARASAIFGHRGFCEWPVIAERCFCASRTRAPTRRPRRIEGPQDLRPSGPEPERGVLVPPKASDEGACAAASDSEPFEVGGRWMRASQLRADRRRRAFEALREDGP